MEPTEADPIPEKPIPAPITNDKRPSKTDRLRSLRHYATWISLIVSGISLFVSHQVAMKNKALDVMLGCQSRYERIAFDVRKETEEGKWKPEDYYFRYWNLQFDQYQFCQRSLIDKDTYRSWMFYRYREYVENATLKGMTYKQGFDKFASENPLLWEFEQYIREIFAGTHPLIRDQVKKWKATQPKTP